MQGQCLTCSTIITLTLNLYSKTLKMLFSVYADTVLVLQMMQT